MQDLDLKIKVVEEVLFQNKIGNYTKYPLRLLAYLIITNGESKLVKFSYEDKWLGKNLTPIQYKRSLAFLKQMDILRVSLKREGYFEIAYRFLKRIVIEELTIEMLLEILKRQKRKLKVKKLFIGKRTKEEENVSAQNFQRGAKAPRSLYVTPQTLKTLKTKKLASNKLLSTKKCKSLLRTKKLLSATGSIKAIYSHGLNPGALSSENKSVKTSGERIKTSNDTRKFLKEAKKKGVYTSRGKVIRKDSTELYGQFKFNPSENPKLSAWQKREVGKWRSIDFLGYYICLYKRITGFENIMLQNDKVYLKVKKLIRLMLKEWFNQDRELMKKYIAWGIYHFTHNMNERYAPSIGILLNPYNQTRWIYDLFIKTMTSKKKKGRRTDLEWSSYEAWEDE